MAYLIIWNLIPGLSSTIGNFIFFLLLGFLKLSGFHLIFSKLSYYYTELQHLRVKLPGYILTETQVEINIFDMLITAWYNYHMLCNTNCITAWCNYHMLYNTNCITVWCNYHMLYNTNCITAWCNYHMLCNTNCITAWCIVFFFYLISEFWNGYQMVIYAQFVNDPNTNFKLFIQNIAILL